jgi:putative ABC transport system permease protein
MFQHLPLIWKNSVRNKRRSVLTIASVAASLCLLGFLGAMYEAMFLAPSAPEQALRLITRNRVSLANPLPVAYRQRIAQVEGVTDVMILQWYGGTYQDPANFFGRMGVEADKLRKVYPEYRIPDDQFDAFMADRTGCVVGRKTANRFGFKIGDRIPLIGDIFPVNLTFTVRAIYDADRDNENLFFHYEYLNQSMRTSGFGGRMDNVGTFVLRMARPDDATRIAKTVDEMFRNAPRQTKTETERAFELSFLAFLGNVKMFLAVICSAITFTILLVTGNTMAMSVRERTREVGILKTIGFTPSKVLVLLVGEALVISLLGGILGLLLARGLVTVVRNAPSTAFDASRIGLHAPVITICLLVSGVIGLVSSFVPAWNAARRNIIDSLRVAD